ncbi:MAG: type II secretion system F family protein [Betaproteobacteria bacterium]
MDNFYALTLLLTFLATVLFVLGAYVVWNAYWGQEAQRTAWRLRAISAGDSARGQSQLLRRRGVSEIPSLERMLLRVPRIHALDRFIVQSGLDLTVSTFASLTLLAAAATFALSLFLGAPAWLALILAAIALALWLSFVQYQRVRRMHAIDRQLPDVLDLMARAMQAGHAFSSALQLAGTDGPRPIATEFQTTFDEINYGMPLEQALQNLAARVNSEYLRFFVVSVLIQQETGGNLSDILISIATLIRERLNLAAHVRVLSTEGRISAWVLVLLPFILAFVIWIINPPFISQLWTDPLGLRVLGLVLVLMAIGTWWMRQMVHFRS